MANVPIDDSVEMDGVVIDYAKDKRIVAIEMLDASKRTTRKPLNCLIVWNGYFLGNRDLGCRHFVL
ncbi:MAG TPA: DUF2283 domain-containing protein [Candidatus Binatia bacterium]|nr:DUF2283 domain-containing protein [Candidatus Binatia bacterium]